MRASIWAHVNMEGVICSVAGGVIGGVGVLNTCKSLKEKNQNIVLIMKSSLI